MSFVRGLSLEDGASTLTDFTARVIGSALLSLLSYVNNKLWRVLVCGGGRKNHVLIEMTRDQYWNKYGSPGDHEVWKNLDRFFRHRSSYFKDYGNWIGSLFTRRLFYSREYYIE